MINIVYFFINNKFINIYKIICYIYYIFINNKLFYILLMFSYIVLTGCTEVCVLTARKLNCPFTQVIRVVMSIFGQSL